MEVTRKQRRSDGTLTVAGVRYEIPSAYRTLVRPSVRVARWDLSCVELVDPRRGTHLGTLYPVDKERNADRRRRSLAPIDAPPESIVTPTRSGIAPLMREYMADYAATGLPPAYIPRDSTVDDNHHEETDT